MPTQDKNSSHIRSAG